MQARVMRMNWTALLRQMLPGFLPLFVFVVVDEIWGTAAGLYVAVAFGVAELAWTWLRERRFDRFVVGDTALLILLGGISALLENDIFFRLKPALIEAILCAVLGLSAFSSKNIVLLMSRRYMKGLEIEFDETKLALMRRSLRIMFFLFSFHTLLIVYAAFFMSGAAWAFISGGLFYILFGVYFAVNLSVQWLRARARSWRKKT